MKPVRLLLILLGLLLALVLVAGGVALVPAVQRWAVLRAARGTPGLKFEATTIAAGISRLRLAGVQAEEKGLAVQLEYLEADYSLWQLLFRRRLVLGDLKGRGLVLDASRLSREKTGVAAAGAPAMAPGVLTRLELPFAVLAATLETFTIAPPSARNIGSFTARMQ